MRTIKSFRTIAICIVIFSTVSCKKESNNSEDIQSLITSKKWVLDKKEYKTGNKDWENGLLDCQTDDTWKFESNNTIIIDEGEIKCGAQQQYAETWNFSNEGKEIIIGPMKYNIETFDKTKLVILNTDHYPNGDTFLTRIQFIR